MFHLNNPRPRWITKTFHLSVHQLPFQSSQVLELPEDHDMQRAVVNHRVLRFLQFMVQEEVVVVEMLEVPYQTNPVKGAVLELPHQVIPLKVVEEEGAAVPHQVNPLEVVVVAGEAVDCTKPETVKYAILPPKRKSFRICAQITKLW